MRSSRKAILVTVVMAVFLLLALTVPAMAGTAPAPKATLGPEGPGWADSTFNLGPKEKEYRALAARVGAQALIPKTVTGVVQAPAVLDTFDVMVSDSDPDFAGSYSQTFRVVEVGDHGIICVAEEAYQAYLTDGTYYVFDNPSGTDTPDEPWTRSEDLITPAQLSYMCDVFDTTIWDTMSANFGTPLFRPAADPDGDMVWILIFNIRDEMYHGKDATSYIAGYFSGSEDLEEDKNMIHIDTYDWINRMGPDSNRPYLYEGVFAHEYEHLLHADADPDEESWVDEGMAELAMFLCGFAEDPGHVIEFIKWHYNTSLTFFAGNLENYGADYLFQLYLWENYGGNAFSTALFHDPDNGITGVQNQLSAFRPGAKFDKVYDAWTLANYFDGAGPTRFGYQNIDLGPDTYGYTIPQILTDGPIYAPWGFPYTLSYYDLIDWIYDGAYPNNPALLLPFQTTGADFYGIFGMTQPYTSQYYLFNPTKTIKATLAGDKSSGPGAYAGTKAAASGVGAWAYTGLQQSVTISGDDGEPFDAALRFNIWYEIEPDWDYFYVEVQDGTEWYTLPIENDLGDVMTVDYDDQEQINPNAPAGRQPKDYEAAGRWNALTDTSSGWVHANVDLSQFSGKTITIYLRTWQDGAFTYQMVYLDNVSLEGTGLADLTGFESGFGNWTTGAAGETHEWTVSTAQFANNWQGTLVQIGKTYPTNWRAILTGSVTPTTTLTTYATRMNAATQTGSITGRGTGKTAPNWLYIVSNRADHIISADYTITAKEYWQAQVTHDGRGPGKPGPRLVLSA